MSIDRRPELPRTPEEAWDEQYHTAWENIFSSSREYTTTANPNNRGYHFKTPLPHPIQPGKDVCIELTPGMGLNLSKEQKYKIETLQLRIYSYPDSEDSSQGIQLLAATNAMLEHTFDPLTNLEANTILYTQSPDLYSDQFTKSGVLAIMQKTKLHINQLTKLLKDKQDPVPTLSDEKAGIKEQEITTTKSEEPDSEDWRRIKTALQKLDDTLYTTTVPRIPSLTREELFSQADRDQEPDNETPAEPNFSKYIRKLGHELGYDDQPNP